MIEMVSNANIISNAELVWRLVARIEGIIKDTKSTSKIERPRLGPYGALEQIEQALREFKELGPIGE